jgi:hypothetical protein
VRLAAVRERIVAIGLLTQKDLGLLGPAFDRAFPLRDARDFDGLLKAVDEADEKLRRRTAGGRQPA